MLVETCEAGGLCTEGERGRALGGGEGVREGPAG